MSGKCTFDYFFPLAIETSSLHSRFTVFEVFDDIYDLAHGESYKPFPPASAKISFWRNDGTLSADLELGQIEKNKPIKIDLCLHVDSPFLGSVQCRFIFSSKEARLAQAQFVQIRGEILTNEGETIIDDHGSQMNASGLLVALADTVLDEFIDTHIFIQNTSASGESAIPRVEMVNGATKEPILLPPIPKMGMRHISASELFGQNDPCPIRIIQDQPGVLFAFPFHLRRGHVFK